MNIKITDLPRVDKRRISVEVNSNQLLNLNKLSTLRPDFVGVTWIGNFDTEILEEIPPIKMAKKLICNDLVVLLHLPCRNLSKKSALEVLTLIKSVGVRNILALKGQSAFVEEKDDLKVDFPYASHFIKFIRQNFDDYFVIGVAGYPEKHPDSISIEEDMNYLKDKVSKGADFILTQASFEDSMYDQFYERCLSYSINIPIFAGSIFLRSSEELKMIRLCKISDSNVVKEFLENQDGNELFQHFGKRKFLDSGRNILKNGKFAGIHVFLMNNSKLDGSFIDVLNELMT